MESEYVDEEEYIDAEDNHNDTHTEYDFTQLLFPNCLTYTCSTIIMSVSTIYDLVAQRVRIVTQK